MATIIVTNCFLFCASRFQVVIKFAPLQFTTYTYDGISYNSELLATHMNCWKYKENFDWKNKEILDAKLMSMTFSILCLTTDVSIKVMKEKSVTSARAPRKTSAQQGDRYGVTDHDISVTGSWREVTLPWRKTKQTYPLQTCYERNMLPLLHAVCLKVLVFFPNILFWLPKFSNYFNRFHNRV